MAPVIFEIGRKQYTVHHKRGPRGVQGFILVETKTGGAFLMGYGNRIRADTDVDTTVIIGKHQVSLKIRLVKE